MGDSRAKDGRELAVLLLQIGLSILAILVAAPRLSPLVTTAIVAVALAFIVFVHHHGKLAKHLLMGRVPRLVSGGVLCAGLLVILAAALMGGVTRAPVGNATAPTPGIAEPPPILTLTVREGDVVPGGNLTVEVRNANHSLVPVRVEVRSDDGLQSYNAPAGVLALKALREGRYVFSVPGAPEPLRVCVCRFRATFDPGAVPEAPEVASNVSLHVRVQMGESPVNGTLSLDVANSTGALLCWTDATGCVAGQNVSGIAIRDGVGTFAVTGTSPGALAWRFTPDAVSVGGPGDVRGDLFVGRVHISISPPRLVVGSTTVVTVRLYLGGNEPTVGVEVALCGVPLGEAPGDEACTEGAMTGTSGVASITITPRSAGSFWLRAGHARIDVNLLAG